VRIYSTQEVANSLGVHKSTLLRWLYSGRVIEPTRTRFATHNYRIWSESDVQRLREFKRANYRKKPRRKKVGRTKTKKSKS
jgi:excisionase family DNA binding protein